MCGVLPSTVVNCSDPGLVENAVRHEHQNLPAGFEYGVTVVYQCKRGFYLLGSSALTCMANGLWDRSLPKCLGEWGRLAFKEHCQHNICSFFFLILLKKVLIFYSLLLTPSQIILVFMISLRRHGTWSALPGPCFPCVHSSVLVSCFSLAGGQILWFTRVPAASRLCLLQHTASLGTQVQRYCKRL